MLKSEPDGDLYIIVIVKQQSGPEDWLTHCESWLIVIAGWLWAGDCSALWGLTFEHFEHFALNTLHWTLEHFALNTWTLCIEHFALNPGTLWTLEHFEHFALNTLNTLNILNTLNTLHWNIFQKHVPGLHQTFRPVRPYFPERYLTTKDLGRLSSHDIRYDNERQWKIWQKIRL